MECIFTKKYEKVDSFLKRFLSHSRYAGVRLIEPCVAVSNIYNKQFKFVVLADEWLYVTENPPKTAKDIQEVTRIEDITSVELINDVPEFLGGNLKYRTHHILVTYRKHSESNLPSQLTPNSSPTFLARSLHQNELRKSKSEPSSLDENGSTGQDGLPRGRTSRKARHKHSLSTSLQENYLKTSKRQFSTNILEENSPLRQDALRKPKGMTNLSKSLQENDLKEIYSTNALGGTSSLLQDGLRNSKEKTNLSKSLEENDLKNSRRKYMGNELDKDYSFSQDVLDESLRKCIDDLSPILTSRDARQSRKKRLKENSRNALEEDSNHPQQNKLSPTARSLKGIGESRRSKSSNSKIGDLPLVTLNYFNNEDGSFETGPIPLHHSFSTIDDLRSKNSSKVTRLTVSASDADLRAAMVEFNPKISTLNSGSDTNLTSTPKRGLMGSFNGLHNWFKERRSGDKSVSQSSDDLEESLAEEGEKYSEIHLYMILDDTIMLSYLRSTWDNCLLNSALKFAKKGRSPKTVVKNKPNSSQVTALFDQMEKEILNSEDFEVTFELIHELLTACQKDVLVKKLFWQSPDLFVFLVKKVNQYIKESDGDTKRNRADELEFAILLFECLTEMFRETELLSSRLTCLRIKKYSVVRDLILASIACAELGSTSTLIQTPDISEAAEILLTGRPRTKKDSKEKTAHDMELENLTNELIKHQIALLHELFIIAYQAVWFPSDDKTLNITWMIKIVESSETVHRFLQLFIQQVMNIANEAENNSLTSDDTTLLYRLLSVLKTLLQQSLKLRQHIHDYYTEEFRYYLKPHTILNSLSKDCPLTPSMLILIDDVIVLATDAPKCDRRPLR